MMIYIGLDDTDVLESRGTGRLARAIADDLSRDFTILGVVRHQFLQDARIPYTSHNSSAVILADGKADADLNALMGQISQLMLADFQPGSDPGLCVTMQVPESVVAFGQRAQREVVTQKEARDLAAAHGIALCGLGGTQDGVIGALAGVGLAFTGEDGRYLAVGNVRSLTGLVPVADVLGAGVAAIQTQAGEAVDQGLILADKIRPARRGGRPVAMVAWEEDHWLPLKVN